MEQTYDVVFFKITQVVLTRDLHLSEVIEQVKHVDVTQLGLPTTALHHAHQRVNSAVTIFQNISTFRTPFEKLDCILSTIYALSSSTGIMDTSDTLVPLLLLTVIQSRVPHLTAHFTYMKEYTFGLDVIGGKYGFALSTLEGVLVYLAESALLQLATVSRQNLQLWRCLKTLPPYEEDGRQMKHLYYQCHPSYSTSSSSTPLSPKSSISSGFSFVIRDRQGNTPLLLACQSGQLAYIPFLANYERVTIATLIMAVRSGSVDVVNYLLEQYEWSPHQLDGKATGDGIPSDNTSSSSVDMDRTPVHLAACLYDDPTILKRLVRAGATLDSVDDQGNNPLHLACIKQDTLLSTSSSLSPTIDYLLQHLPPRAIYQQNDNGDTFFHLCAHPLEQHQVIVDTVNKQGRSPWLNWAAKGQFMHMISLLDHHNVDQFRLDYYGRTGLHYVASQLDLLEQTFGNNGSTMEFYIKKLVCALRDLVHVRDRTDGNTPLHMAALSSKTLSKRASIGTYGLFMEVLLNNGADMNAYNYAGERPIDLCDTSVLPVLEAWCLKTRSKASTYPDKDSIPSWAVTRVVTDPVSGQILLV
ncbi:ankyrin repeat-containing domain protein [Chlamydoabsidia padenii]|nr:ankyrin repeat-containing domain protein [Chlamydoabsidia padenii]